MRLAAKRDENEPEIVDGLERVGIHVFRSLPCDLLTFRAIRCPHCHGNQWLPLEVKMPHARQRNDQKAQTEFLRLTGVPIVRTLDDALRSVGVLHV